MLVVQSSSFGRRRRRRRRDIVVDIDAIERRSSTGVAEERRALRRGHRARRCVALVVCKEGVTPRANLKTLKENLKCLQSYYTDWETNTGETIGVHDEEMCESSPLESSSSPSCPSGASAVGVADSTHATGKPSDAVDLFSPGAAPRDASFKTFVVDV